MRCQVATLSLSLYIIVSLLITPPHFSPSLPLSLKSQRLPFCVLPVTSVAEGRYRFTDLVSEAMEDIDWDLHAVVRGCSASTSTTLTATATINSNSSSTTGGYRSDYYPQYSCFSGFGSDQAGHLFSHPDPYETRNADGELDELYKPFSPKTQPPLFSPQACTPISSFSSFASFNKDLQTQPKQQQKKSQPKQIHAGSVTSSINSHTPRSKRR